jgi:hypothetical protein
MRDKVKRLVMCIALALASVGLVIAPAYAQGTTPPDLSVCEGVTCDNLNNSVCRDAGFKITLLGVDPANFLKNDTSLV